MKNLTTSVLITCLSLTVFACTSTRAAIESCGELSPLEGTGRTSEDNQLEGGTAVSQLSLGGKIVRTKRDTTELVYSDTVVVTALQIDSVIVPLLTRFASESLSLNDGSHIRLRSFGPCKTASAFLVDLQVTASHAYRKPEWRRLFLDLSKNSVNLIHVPLGARLHVEPDTAYQVHSIAPYRFSRRNEAGDTTEGPFRFDPTLGFIHEQRPEWTRLPPSEIVKTKEFTDWFGRGFSSTSEDIRSRVSTVMQKMLTQGQSRSFGIIAGRYLHVDLETAYDGNHPVLGNVQRVIVDLTTPNAWLFEMEYGGIDYDSRIGVPSSVEIAGSEASV